MLVVLLDCAAYTQVQLNCVMALSFIMFVMNTENSVIIIMID